MLQVFPVGYIELKVTELPVQNVVGPDAVIIGVGNGGKTVICMVAVELQLPAVVVTT